jgi:cytochrome P450
LDAIGDDGSIPSLDQLKHLPFIDSCIKESLRLCPSVAQLPGRVLADEYHLSNGYILPKGSRVILSIYSLHHNRKYWGDDVEEFRPDRFDEQSANGGKKVDPYLWVPFSYGSRSCIGQQFSMIEQRVVLTMLRKCYLTQQKALQPANLPTMFLVQRHIFKLPADSPHKERLQFGSGGLLHPHNLRLEITNRV